VGYTQAVAGEAFWWEVLVSRYVGRMTTEAADVAVSGVSHCYHSCENALCLQRGRAAVTRSGLPVWGVCNTE
jgi:hypothetical protein